MSFTIPQADQFELIALGKLAPSGHNLKQWDCVFEENVLFIKERKDIPRLKSDLSGYYVAITFGGFAHNIIGYSKNLGYNSRLAALECSGRIQIAIEFEKINNCILDKKQFLKDNPLRLRKTTRGCHKPIDPNIINAAEVERIAAGTGIGIEALADKNAIGELAKALSKFEALSLTCIFSRKDLIAAVKLYEKCGIGLAPQAVVSDLFGKVFFNFALEHPERDVLWNFMARIHKYRETVNLQSSSVYFALSFKNNEDQLLNYFQLGYVLSKLWIRCSELGLAACPLMSFSMLRDCPEGCNRTSCSKPGKDFYKDYFKVEPQLLFRVGGL